LINTVVKAPRALMQRSQALLHLVFEHGRNLGDVIIASEEYLL